MSVRAAILLALVLGCHRRGSAPPPPTAPDAAAAPDPAIPAARAVIERVMTEHALVGVQVAVARRGRVVWSQGFGLADVAAGRPVTPATRFRLGSVSKVVTAALVGRIVEQKKLDLDAPIGGLVPDLPAAWQGITARQLAGHLGGIRHYTFKDFTTARAAPYPSVAASLAAFRDDPLVAAPGERYVYSTYGYTLLSRVLERAGGAPFLLLLDREIVKPMGLAATGPDDGRDDPARTSFYQPGGQPAPPHDSSVKWAGGGLLSTAEDMVRFASAHPTSFAPATLATLWTPLATTGGRPTGVGVAWRVATTHGRRSVQHAGNVAGSRAMLLFFPDDPTLAVAVLVNVTGTPKDIEAVADEIAANFLR